MLKFLDRDGNASIDMAEWHSWHEFMHANLPERYKSFNQFLELLESLLEQWKITEEKRRSLKSVSPVRTEWARTRRTARTPRTPRTPRKTASKSLMDYKGHTDWILAVAILELNGAQLLVSASQDMTSRVFEVQSGDLVSTCSAHTGSVLAISWIPSDSSSCYTGSLDGHVCRWDLMSGELVSQSIDCHKKGVLCLQTAPDGKTVFTGSRDNTAARWDLETGKELQRYTGHTKWIQCLSLSQTKLYTGGADETVREWDTGSGACLHVLKGHSQEVISMTISGNYLYTGSREAVARRWDLSTKE